ncbi:MAG: DUF3052 family protein [Flavobacteriales bacterium]|nr:DUF3052 family protein [Flavobacteriales bacterium]
MKPTFEKLNIKEGMRVAVIGEVSGYRQMVEAPEGWMCFVDLAGSPQLIHVFVQHADELERIFPSLKQQIPKDGAIWVSWPKAKSALPRTINENIIRDTGLALGLVDNKVCSVNEDWSALRFVYRLRDRG